MQRCLDIFLCHFTIHNDELCPWAQKRVGWQPNREAASASFALSFDAERMNVSVTVRNHRKGLAILVGPSVQVRLAWRNAVVVFSEQGDDNETTIFVFLINRFERRSLLATTASPKRRTHQPNRSVAKVVKAEGFTILL